MKRTCLLAVAVIGTFVLIQTAQAYPRGGGGHSFSGGGHFSAPRSSGGGGHYSSGGFRGSAPSRSFSSAQPRYYGPRTSIANTRSYGGNRPRYSPPTTGVRNPTYTGNRGRLGGNRTTAFNTRTY